jgi:hypothetical protein
MMDANLILIDDDTEFARARALVETLWDSEAPPMMLDCGRKRC